MVYLSLKIRKMWISAIYLFLLHFSSAERDHAPVFVIDYEKKLSHLTTEPNPFSKMKSSDFSTIIEEATKRAKTVILFIEESFCIEDVSLKDKHGSPFYHLGQALRENRVKFLPSVSQPFKTLKSHLKANQRHIFYLSDSSSKLRIYDQQLKYFYIYFTDKVNETRASALRRHDLLIKEVYFVVSEMVKKSVIAFYTGKFNPIVVEKMNFLPIKSQKVPQNPAVMIFSNGALFKFIGVYSTSGTRRSMFSQIPLVAEETWSAKSLVTRMAYTDFELEFSFDFKEDRWIMDNVALLEWGEEVGRTPLKIGAPWHSSYMCSDPIVLINLRDGSAVTISHYQIQPFLSENTLTARDGDNSNATNTTNRCFGPAVNCGPYFNAHILAGLMVSSFCLGILTYGVVSLYNIHANDRYDDPLGKPLVIAAEAGSN